jgi:hypothetical protein
LSGGTAPSYATPSALTCGGLFRKCGMSKPIIIAASAAFIGSGCALCLAQR